MFQGKQFKDSRHAFSVDFWQHILAVLKRLWQITTRDTVRVGISVEMGEKKWKNDENVSRLLDSQFT